MNREMKSQKYQDLQEQYENDEITEEELEQQMDDLFESGDDFLDHEDDSGPVLSDDARFRIREIGQIVGAAILIPTVLYTIYITNGAIIPIFIPIGLFIAMYKMGFFR